VLTNDPAQPDMLLDTIGTVSRRLMAAPSPVTLTIDSSKPATERQRTVHAFIYSERWNRFALTLFKTSRPGMTWRSDPAEADTLKELHAQCGYRVEITMPEVMPEGRFLDWIEFVGKPSDAQKNAGQAVQVDIQGSVNGRLVFYGAKIQNDRVLLLGTLEQGHRVRETVVLKINDPRRQLHVEHIETEPAFLQAKLLSYADAAKNNGLYRLEIEIPSDSPSCARMGEHPGVVRLKTDHPRLPVIELLVNFSLVAADGVITAP
jgi:hypothetical protein